MFIYNLINLFLMENTEINKEETKEQNTIINKQNENLLENNSSNYKGHLLVYNVGKKKNVGTIIR